MPDIHLGRDTENRFATIKSDDRDRFSFQTDQRKFQVSPAQ